MFHRQWICSMCSFYRPTDEEAEQLLQLMTSRPPATPAGVRFVSLSFCKLLAFPTLVRYIKLVSWTPTFTSLCFIQQTQMDWDHKPHSAVNSGFEFWFSANACCLLEVLSASFALIVLCYSVNVCVCVSSTPEQEQLMVMWLSWMIKEEEYFER